jgi:hypothetical protein
MLYSIVLVTAVLVFSGLCLAFVRLQTHLRLAARSKAFSQDAWSPFVISKRDDVALQDEQVEARVPLTASRRVSTRRRLPASNFPW